MHEDAWLFAYRGIIEGAHLNRMVNRRGAAWWEAVIRKGGGVLVLEMDGRIAGYVTFGPSRLKDLSYRGEIYELYLKPEYHGMGCGRALFEAACDALSKRGLNSVVIRALTDNIPATAFYAAMGAAEVARRLEVVGKQALPVVVFGWRRAERRAA